MEEFAAQVAAVRGQPGSRTAAELLAWVRPRTDSPKESSLRLIVLDAGYPEPEVNFEVVAHDWPHSLDLAWVEPMIDLEFQGGHHFSGEHRRGDLYRRRALEALGWTVVEVTGSDLRAPAAFLAQLSAAFESARRRH
jgi:hypothetical protein